MEPSKLLKKLSSLVNEKREKKGSWVTVIVIFFISAFAIFVFAWLSGKNAKELAKLRHEKNKKKVEEENLKVKMHRELNEDRILKLAIEIDENKTQIKSIDKLIWEAAKAHQENLQNINSISGWKDI